MRMSSVNVPLRGWNTAGSSLIAMERHHCRPDPASTSRSGPPGAARWRWTCASRHKAGDCRVSDGIRAHAGEGGRPLAEDPRDVQIALGIDAVNPPRAVIDVEIS